MTDRLAALRAIVFYGVAAEREQVLAQFHRDWHHDTLVMNQWFAVQAAMPLGDTLARVQALLLHPAFDVRNPNKVRSLVGVFASQNPVQFHRIDGAGYRFLADTVVQLNQANPQLASRPLTPDQVAQLHRPGRADVRPAGAPGGLPELRRMCSNW